MIKVILTEPNKILRTKSAPVNPEKIKTPAFRELLSDMVETMIKADGVGLAANQIGITERIIIANIGEPTPLVNPEIVGHSILKINSEEGCLSVPGRWDTIRRWRSVKIRALDKNGKEVRMSLRGLPAIILQHEIDHLNGILFIDRIGKK